MTMNPPSQSPAASYDPALSLGEPVSGWLLFAGTVLGLAGLMRVFDAIWAFAYNGALPQHLQDSVLGSNLTTYAWLWLIVGALLIVSSFLLLSRSQLARWVGFVAAAVLALSAMAWMPYYPVWSLTYVGIAVLTFYALAVHGGRE
jgi:hypothetical protein